MIFNLWILNLKFQKKTSKKDMYYYKGTAMYSAFCGAWFHSPLTGGIPVCATPTILYCLLETLQGRLKLPWLRPFPALYMLNNNFICELIHVCFYIFFRYLYTKSAKKLYGL